MVTFEIQADELPGGQLVDDLVEYIESKLPKVTVKKDGSAILVTGEEGIFSKRKLRFLARKFLYSAGLRPNTKVISAGGPAYRILHTGIELEEEEEELEELEDLEDVEVRGEEDLEDLDLLEVEEEDLEDLDLLEVEEEDLED